MYVVWGYLSNSSTVTFGTELERIIRVFPKWKGNLVNSVNLIYHCSMNSGQVKDPL